VFLSYSHDSDAHKDWVRQLAARLRRGGVEVTLDQWQLRLGGDVVRFMDLGIREADRVLMVCTANYVAKAEERKGGAGYEGMIVTGHVARNTDTIKFVPIVRDNAAEPLIPAFLGQRLWVDFRDDGRFEQRLEDLLRELHGVPLHQPPPLGPNPFAGPARPEPPGRGDFVSSGDSVVSGESVGSGTSVVRGRSVGSGESVGSGVSLAGEESARGVDPFGGDPDGGGGSVGGGEAAGRGPVAGRSEPAGPGPVIGGRQAAAREPVVGRREDAGPGAVIGSGDSERCEPVVGGRDAAGPGPLQDGRPQPGAHAAEQGSSASVPQAPKPAAFASPTAPPSTHPSAPPFTPPSAPATAPPASPSPSAPPTAPPATPPSAPAPPLTPAAGAAPARPPAAPASPQPLALRPLTLTTASLRREGNQWQTERQEVNVQACDLELGEGESLRLIQIPAGEFLMGSPASDPQRFDDEGPQHRVRLTSFLLGQTPVTQSQWQQVAGWPKLKLDLSANPSRFKDSRRPVERVNWLEAMEFCRRLSRHSGHVFSLPSEAQWEYACRAGTTTPFAFGDTITPELANYDGNYIYANGPKGQFRREITPVAIFPPNAWGLHDMHGNVLEWCLDHWHPNYQGAPTDGSAWLDGEGLNPENNNETSRLLRGGSWDDLPRRCRSACRDLNQPGYADSRVGFRVVCLPQDPSLNS
jgi:formylglycine-generating enzyme required for sulfatase activity